MVGVASNAVRNTATCYSHADSMLVYFYEGGSVVFCDSKNYEIPNVKIQTGTRIRVTVDRHAGEMEWIQMHPSQQLIS